MIEEQATVLACEGAFALVETQRQTTCGDCSARSGCGTAALARFFGSRHSTIRVRNNLDARPGDRVVIGLDEAAVGRASLLLYGLPIAGLIIGALLGHQTADGLGSAIQELASIVLGLLGLSLGLLVVRRLAAGVTGNRRYQAVLLRRSSAARGVYVDGPRGTGDQPGT